MLDKYAYYLRIKLGPGASLYFFRRFLAAHSVLVGAFAYHRVVGNRRWR